MDRRKAARALVGAGLVGHALFLPLSIAGTQIALGAVAAGLLLDRPKDLRTVLDWPALAFVLVAIASDASSRYGMPDLASATLWRAVIGFFIVSYGLRASRDPAATASLLLSCVCASMILGSLVGLIQYRTGFDLVHALGLRSQPAWVEAPGVPGRFGAMGFFTSRLTFGHNLTVLLALVAGTLASGTIPRRRVWLPAIAIVLGLSALAITFDRAAYLAVCAAALVLIGFAAGPLRKVFAAVVCAGVIVAALHPAVRSRFESGFSGTGNADRLFIWARSLEIIRDHPLHGIGFANYPRITNLYYGNADPARIMRTWAHNLELSTLAETGPLGLLALLWLFGSAIAAAWLRAREGRPYALGALAALAALLVIAQVHDVIYDTKVMYALWFAVALGLSHARGIASSNSAVGLGEAAG